jgi:hypothetical protein
VNNVQERVNRLCDGLILHPRNFPGYLRVKKLKGNKAFDGCPILQIGGNRKKKEREENNSICKNLVIDLITLH